MEEEYERGSYGEEKSDSNYDQSGFESINTESSSESDYEKPVESFQYSKPPESSEPVSFINKTDEEIDKSSELSEIDRELEELLKKQNAKVKLSETRSG